MNIVSEEYKCDGHLHKPTFDTTVTEQIKQTKKDFKEHIRDIMPLIDGVFHKYDNIKENIVLQDAEAEETKLENNLLMKALVAKLGRHDERLKNMQTSILSDYESDCSE